MKPFLLIFLLPALVSAAPEPLFQSLIIDENLPGRCGRWWMSMSRSPRNCFSSSPMAAMALLADWADWAEPRLIMADGKEQKLTRASR